MRELMSDVGLPEPVFQKEGIFTVMLQRPESLSLKSRVKSRVKILSLMSTNPSITASMLANELSVTVKAIEKQIATLKKEGLIDRIGADNGGFWKIRKQVDDS